MWQNLDGEKEREIISTEMIGANIMANHFVKPFACVA